MESDRGLPSRRRRGVALIGAAGVVIAGASLAYVWPELARRVAAPTSTPQQVQVLAASFPTAESGWVVAKDSSLPNGPTGIYRTSDGGRHWTSLPVPLTRSYAPLLEFFDTSHGVLLLLRDEAAGRPRLFATGSGGSGWDALPLPVEANAAAGVAAFADPRTGWFLLPRTGGGSRLWRTRDGAASWQELRPPALAGGQLGMAFFDPLHGVLTGGALWTTGDGGDSWRLQPDGVPLGAALGPVRAAGGELRAAVTWPGGGAVLTSHDGGGRWALVPVPASGLVHAAALDGVDDWYVAAGDRLLVSRDGGATWSVLRPRLPAGVELGALALRGTAGWSIGARSAEASVLLHTVDGGRTWTAVGLPRVS